MSLDESGLEREMQMFRNNKDVKEEKVPSNITIESLDTKTKLGSYISSILISLGLSAAGIYFIFAIQDPIERWVCGLGLVFVAVCIYFISMAGQSIKNYRFEFAPNQGLRDFKLFYKGVEIAIDYKLDKDGRFMWGDYRSKAKCITYADGRKASLFFNNYTKYRIMNYMSGLFEQNNLMSKKAY